jgi:hypothetical protein
MGQFGLSRRNELFNANIRRKNKQGVPKQKERLNRLKTFRTEGP